MPIFHKISVENARPQIREAIAEGNIAAAIHLLRQSGSDAAAMLQKKLSEAEQQRALAQINPEAWADIQAQICRAILELDWMNEATLPKILAAKDKIRLLQLLDQHQTEQVLLLCKDLGNNYLLLQMQLNLACNQSGTGLMESEYWEATKSKINYTLQEMIAALPGEKPAKTNIFNKIRKFFTS